MRKGRIMLEQAIRNSLDHMFDFTYNYEFGGILFPLHGKFYQRSAKYVAVKKAEIYAFSNYEYLYLHRVRGVFTKAEFERLAELFKTELKEIVKPHEEHMSSMVSVIVECEGIEDGLEQIIKKFRYKKTFKWGFQGWADIKFLVLISKEKIEDNTIDSNHIGAELEASGKEETCADLKGRYTIIESKLAKGDAKKLKLTD